MTARRPPEPQDDPALDDAVERLAREWNSLAGVAGTAEGLLVPSAGERTWLGTNLPALTQNYVPITSGLLLPEGSAPGSIGVLMKTFMTPDELLGEAISIEKFFALIHHVSVEDLLACVGWIVNFLRINGSSDESTHLALADRFLDAAAKRRATGMIQNHSVFMAPQLLLGVAKLGILTGDPARPTTPGDDPMHNVVAATLALAQWFGADTFDEDERWGPLPEKLALEMVANQHFNHERPLAALMARYESMWRDLPAARDQQVAAAHEAAFATHTGATFEDCRFVGMLLWAQSRSHGLAHFQQELIAGWNLTTGQLAALDLFVSDLPEFRQLLDDEVGRVGVEWAANTMRRFPLVRHPSGAMTMFDPEFLVQRTFGMAAYWELNEHYNSKGSKAWGRFKTFRGLVVEDYVAECFASVAPGLPGGAQQVWREDELKLVWPGKRCCDFVLDFGDTWVCVEVVSHALSEKASTANSVESLNGDIRMAVEEKAEQLNETIDRLIEDETVLTGRPPVRGRKLLPVIVATNGFPVNAAVSAMVTSRLRDEGLLQQAQVGPLEILDLDNIEQMEHVQETGGPSFAELLTKKARSGGSAHGMEHFISSDLHLELNRPTRLQPAFDAQFERIREVAANHLPHEAA